MQKYLKENYAIVYITVFTVIALACLNIVDCSATPKTNFVFDGYSNDWTLQDVSPSTGSGYWGISWNSTCIFIVYNSSAVSWDGSVELVLVFDLNPNVNPDEGYGSNYTKSFSGFQHRLPFTGDFIIQSSPGATTSSYFYSNTTHDWGTPASEPHVQVKKSVGVAEILIDYSNFTSNKFSFQQFYFLGYAQTNTTVMDVTPSQDNGNAQGSGNRTFTGFWGFLGINGVDPVNTIHVNTLSTLPGNTSYYSSPPPAGNFTWSGHWWGLPQGVFPSSQTVVYIPSNYKLHLDTSATVLALFNMGEFSAEASSELNVADGGIVSNSYQCCDNSHMNLNLLGSATFVNGQITDFFNVEAFDGDVAFDSNTRIYGTLSILSANIISSPMYQSGSNLRYSGGSTFSRNQEWNSTISPPRKVIIDGNTGLILGTHGGQAASHEVQGDLIIFPGSTLDLNGPPSLQKNVSIFGDLQNNGSLILSSNLGSSLKVQGSYLHFGSLSRNGQDFNCPNITWTKFDSYCYQNNGSVTVTSSGGFPPISYLWILANETGETGDTLQGLGAGSYNLTFMESNANGCPSTFFLISITALQCDSSSGPEESSTNLDSTIAIALAVAVGGSLLVLGAVVFTTRWMNKKKGPMNDPISLPLEDAMAVVAAKPTISYSSVKDVGVSTEQNPRWRRTMEDEHVIIDKFGGEDGSGYFAVYDGHGGREIAEFVASKLHQSILIELENCYQINSNSNKNPTIAQALRTAYLNTDELIKNENTRSGSTAVTAYLRSKSEDERWLYVANVGDARAVLCRNGVAVRLSMDHKPTDESEASRIKNEGGGWIVQGKVAGMLAVTRSFGDMELKKWVIADPYITETQLKATDTILVVACDGLWDVVDDQSCMDFLMSLYSTDTAQDMADKLLKLAIEKATRDNVSIIVVKL